MHVFIRDKDEICFGHYSAKEIIEMRQDGWRFVHQTTLEEWPKANLKLLKSQNKQQIGVNKHGLPIYK